MNHNYSFWAKNPAYEADTDNNPEEVEVKGELSVTSYGYASNGWDDPGEGPEWGVEEIIVNDVLIEPYLEPESKKLNPEWEKWEMIVNNHLANDYDWASAINDAAEDYDQDRYDY
jgi:hypothetical protein